MDDAMSVRAAFPDRSPLVSIIIPAFNGASFLRETLNSVTAQTYSNWEVVLIDDGSSDETPRIAQEFAAADSRFRVITQRNQGVASARNTGFAAISPGASWVLYLDHDDLLLPDALKTLVDRAVATQSSSLSGVHGLIRIRSGPQDGQLMHEKRYAFHLDRPFVREIPQAEPTTFAVMAHDCCLVTPGAVLLRRDQLETIAGPDKILFDPQTAPCDDWDLYLRLTALAPLDFVPTPVLEWRYHTSNSSHNTARMLTRQSDVRRKTLLSPAFQPEQRELMYQRYRRMFARELRHRANQALREHQLPQAIATYGRYLQARWLWNTLQDRGSIPWCGVTP